MSGPKRLPIEQIAAMYQENAAKAANYYGRSPILFEMRVDGIEASADPLFEPRANVYLMSGRRRRSASKAPSA